MELEAYRKFGGTLRYGCEFQSLRTHETVITGVTLATGQQIAAKTVILAQGGFESNANMRTELLGAEWSGAKVRGSRHNTGDGLLAAWTLGAQRYGRFNRCHTTPRDYFLNDFGNLNIPHGERKNYRKISYFLGVKLNENGVRFADEGIDFRNYTYAYDYRGHSN